MNKTYVDAHGSNWSDARGATAWHWPGKTVRPVRPRLVAQGRTAALARQKQEQPARQRLLDGATEARLLAVRCGPPPHGPATGT